MVLFSPTQVKKKKKELNSLYKQQFWEKRLRKLLNNTCFLR